MSLEEQIMSKDKYPSIFSRKMEAIVFIILQIFFVTRAVLKIGEYHSAIPSFLLRNIQLVDAFKPRPTRKPHRKVTKLSEIKILTNPGLT